MATVSRFRFLAIAMIFHLVYIYSIFDIYFVSPIVSGMQLFAPERPSWTKAPAERLVLFVGDGLRADKAFQSFPEPYPKTDHDLTPRPLAPFLRSRVLEHAGLYEDVSAVATGWKLNPVNFDSVFNRSRHTWSWGSPDILPMFEKGATPGRIDAFCYDAEFEDFSQDAVHLDYWVFDHVKELFTAAEKNKTLSSALRQDKIVFFLHLLGLDTAGHSYRPYSKEYLHNIKVVDQGVKEVTELIQKFYGDDRTAFVFTADHGMSDWGSHGDGHPDNTRTPLIAWGSGVAKPSTYPNGLAPGHDAYSSDWNLNHVRRHDVAQADIAALMAYLIGVEFPANSVGELPLSYLSATMKEKAKASFLNAKEILEIYRVKEEGKKANELRFRPYRPLSGDHGFPAEVRLASIQKLIDDGKYEEAIEESAALMKIGLEGMRYLQTYDWVFLRALITIGYLGWMAYAIARVIDLHVLQGTARSSRSLGGIVFFSSVLVLLYASFIISQSPYTYYAYAFFPVFFWEEVYARRDSLIKANKTEDVTLIMVGGSLMVIVGLLYLIFEDRILADPSSSVTIGLVILAMLVTRSSALSLQARQGLPRGNQVVGWLVLIVSFLMPLAHRLQPNTHYLHRLLVIFLTCAPTFVILTISYEGLFYVTFSMTLLTWVRLEHHRNAILNSKVNNGQKSANPAEAAANTVISQFRPLTLSDARVALFFFVLLQSAFFSTGNIASISSFSMDSVNRLFPVFDPFSQGALLILKLMIPFALISANLGILNKRLGVAPSALFMVVTALSDILTLYFFWVVKDEGSWLEIGSTISHFAIASLLCVFVAALEGVSALFISGIEVGNTSEGKTLAKTNGNAPGGPAEKVLSGTRGGGSNASEPSPALENR
ncbi:hypothetical protein DL766_002607 [Monosporascus sp. MC13-8B]|nr:hypothetical protein DL766_002607 [Monosporascus sp. MC13-8B]